VTIVFVVVTAVVVAAIGLVVIGRVTAKLEQAPPPSLFDIDEAVTFIADRLPYEAAAQLSYDDVRVLVGWHIDYLESRGVAADLGDRPEASAPGSGPLVAEDDEGVAYVIGKAGESDLEITDVQVVQVLEAEMAYLDAIGALGTAVEPPRDV
jgi:hypothetical protein